MGLLMAPIKKNSMFTLNLHRFPACFSGLLTLFFITIHPGPALALQSHGPVEGLYVHQAAHVFFAFSMALFAIRIRYSAIMNPKATKFISTGAILLIVWNIWAFYGHILEVFITPEQIVLPESGERMPPYFYATDWQDIIYYILKMDHIICVPAVACFLAGINIHFRHCNSEKLENGKKSQSSGDR